MSVLHALFHDALDETSHCGRYPAIVQRTEYIKSKEASDNRQFVDVYTDKGITSVSTKKREGFNRMIQGVLAGKIEILSGKWIQTHDCEHGPKPHEIRHFASIA